MLKIPMNKYSLMIRFVNLLIYKPKFYPFKNISYIYEFIFINQNSRRFVYGLQINNLEIKMLMTAKH